MMIYFTSDEHYFHKNIIKYQKRPFQSLEDMHRELIRRHNHVVKGEDQVYHIGDFCFGKKKQAREITLQLNGTHFFLQGNHDKWDKSLTQIIELRERKDDNQESNLIVLCHYAMRVWNESHYNSWQLHGHTHRHLKPIGKQLDVGVDCHNYYPISIEVVKEIMKTREDNWNKIDKNREGAVFV